MAFLSILVIRESHLIVSYEFENAVLVFACANYFLPTVALYQLCLSHFGQKGKSLDLNGVYNISHLLLVNVPYLAVRIYLWSGFGSDISMFVMKNVIAIVWSLKDICTDLMTLHHQCKSRGTGGTPAIASTEKNDEIVELEQISWLPTYVKNKHWTPYLAYVLFFLANRITKSRGKIYIVF